MNTYRNLRVLLIVLILGACTTVEVRNPTEEEKKPTRKLGLEPSMDEAEDTIGHFPIIRNHDVKQWLNYFQTTAPRSFKQWLENGEPFRPAIQQTLESEGVPGALYYMSLIESGFVHKAQSKAKASGPWQFLKETGERYGLKSNSWIDERRDPVKSTHAAAAYLRDLRQRFGDWYLTLAAYNSGPKRIQDAMKKAGTKDFWKIKKAGLLKKETADFVPKMIAAAILGTDPLKFNFPLNANAIPKKFPTGMISIKRPVTLRELSKKLKVQISDIKYWNPELLRDKTPPKSAHGRDYYALRVPEYLAQEFLGLEPTISYLNDFQEYKVAQGDTLQKIAKRHSISLKSIVHANPHLQARKLSIGSKVSIPLLD